MGVTRLMEMNQFADNTGVITGAASGFGKILADKLAANGARLVPADLDLEGLERVAHPLRCELACKKAAEVLRSGPRLMLEIIINQRSST